MKKKRHIGRKASSFELYDELGPITGVALLVDDNNEIVAGSKDGYVLSVECKYGTQTMADNILAAVEGRTYKGFRAMGTLLDPMAELGDGVTIVDTYSILAYRSVNFGPGHMSEIAAPGESVLDHEYQYKSPSQRQTDRKIAKTNSKIAKTAEEIRLEVANELDGMSASFSVELEKIASRVNGLSGAYTELAVTLDGVTVTDEEGTTRIRGNSIDTSTLYVDAAHVSGTLNANLIDASKLKVNAANISGILNAHSLDLDGELCLMCEGEVYGFFGASNFSSAGGYGAALTDPTAMNGFYAFTTGAKMQYGTTDNQVAVINGNVTVAAGGKYYNFTASTLAPGTHAPTLGTSSLYWGDIYSSNSVISTSDREKKNSIAYDIDARYDVLWDLLKPCTGKFNEGTSDRTHMFLISQDVEDAIAEAGLTSQDFAAFIKSPKQDENGNAIEGYNYALRYEEFIPMCIRQIQKLQARVAELEVKSA